MRPWLLGSGLAIVILATFAVAVLYSVRMPGRSFDGSPPPLSPQDRGVRDRLERHVRVLAGDIGERNAWHRDALDRARRYIAGQMEASGYRVEHQRFEFRGDPFYNLEAVLTGTAAPQRSVVIGAHYDSVIGSPGANDNASGVAALLEIAGMMRGRPLPLTVRFVAFPNEEPPFFNTMEGMGSVEYVRRLDNHPGRVVAMISLETIGFYSDAPGSQHYPPPVGLFYPDVGDFIALVGNWRSRSMVHTALRAFRENATIPSEGIAAPGLIPGLSWSDHRSFWQAGIPALMMTDTALFRDPEYHRATDTPARLDYERMARAVRGLMDCVIAVATAPPDRLAGMRPRPAR